MKLLFNDERKAQYEGILTRAKEIDAALQKLRIDRENPNRAQEEAALRDEGEALKSQVEPLLLLKKIDVIAAQLADKARLFNEIAPLIPGEVIPSIAAGVNALLDIGDGLAFQRRRLIKMQAQTLFEKWTALKEAGFPEELAEKVLLAGIKPEGLMSSLSSTASDAKRLKS